MHYVKINIVLSYNTVKYLL